MSDASSNAVFQAIFAAQKAAKALEKDARNDFGQYDYVSTEAMIAAAKSLLSSVGLSVIPLCTEIRRDTGNEEEPLRILHRKYLVATDDGSSLLMDQEWAIVPGKGRPWDKAVASAATTSLNYFLRDLLQIPRVDARDDMDHPSRDEKEEKSAPKPKKPGTEVCPNPDCRYFDTDEAVIKGNPKFGGGYVCWKKKGGCGATWPGANPEPDPLASFAPWRDRINKVHERLVKLAPSREVFGGVCRSLGIEEWKKLSSDSDFQRLYDALLKAGNELQAETQAEMPL